MSKVCLPPIGFLSYVRSDDELLGKRISRLCLLIRGQLQLQLGRDVEIFQDTAKIPHGAAWEKRTREAISSATFFIPIVTPAYLRSKWCAKELRLFREREQQLFDAHPNLAQMSCVFPIHLVEVDEGDADDEGMFDQLRQLQFFEFGDLLFADYDASAVRKEVAGFVADIRNLLKMSVEATKEALPIEAPVPTPVPATPVPAPAPVSVPASDASVSTPEPSPPGSPMPSAPPISTSTERREVPDPPTSPVSPVEKTGLSRVLVALSGAAIIDAKLSNVEPRAWRRVLKAVLHYLVALAWFVVIALIVKQLIYYF